MKKLMAIDGNSIVNRAFYGVHMLTTRDGQPTNAIYGFLNILQKLIDEEMPDALCCTFDLKAPTFRHLRYEGYKAQRKGMPEELASQMPLLKEILDAMRIPRYELEGWEADDLLGTIAATDCAAGWETVIVTGDKDSLQLITPQTRVKLVSTRMGQTTTKEMTPEAFRAEYGFEPIRIVDLKALMGDASDQIPGVPGVGEKTALGLVREHGSLEQIYAQMPNLRTAPDTPAKPNIIKKLDEGRALATLSYELATIHRDAPVDFRPEDAVRREIDAPVLYPLFLRLEFSKLIDKYGLPSGEEGAKAVETPTVSSPDEVETVTTALRAKDLLTRWRGPDRVTVLPLADLSTVAVLWREEGRLLAALFHADRLEDYHGFLKGLFGGDIPKVVHDAKPILSRLLAEGIAGEGILFDTALAAYLLAPTDGSYDLEKLGMSYFNQEFSKTKVYTEAGAFGPLSDRTAPTAALLAHGSLLEALSDTLGKQLEDLGMHTLYYEIELPLCVVLAEMEHTGFCVDRNALAEFGTMLDARISGRQTEIYAQAGEPFNINSTQQLGVILFEKLGLPPVKKTKTGYSTNVEVLEKLHGQHPIIDAIMDYRQLTKLKSTYVDGLSKVIAPDGRIHTSFQNTVTATGRLSSTEPNLQNIPIRTELGAELREMFVPAEGCQLVDADYSQIELRLLAHIADDKTMQEAFQSGTDIHTVTASQVFGVTPEEITHEMRRRAKAVNFGIVYGISDFSLSQDIGVARWEAKDYMDKYFATYAGVRAYMTDVVQKAKADGFVSTLFGRRRALPELKSSSFHLRSFGERVALNMPIQGTAADIMKLAMLHVRDRLREGAYAAHLVLQVHDELIVECPAEETEQVKKLLTEEMEHVAALSVPLIATSAAGMSWAAAKE